MRITGPWPFVRPHWVMVAAFMLMACAGATAQAPQGPATAPKREFNTIGHWMLDEEAKVVPLPEHAIENLERILHQAKEQIHFNAAEPDLALRQKAAIAALNDVDRILMENHIVFPPGNWIDSLGHGFEPHTLNEKDYQAVLAQCYTARRRQFVVDHRNDVFYYMDCDVNCFLYLAVGEVVGMDLKVVEMPHHMFARYYLDDKTYINWETTIPAVKTDAEYLEGAGDEVTDWGIAEGCFLTPRTPEEIRGYFYGCRGLRCQNAKPPNLKQAAADFKKSIELNPLDSITRNNLAWLYLSEPEFKDVPKMDALQLALRAVSMDPADGEDLDTLACAYAEVGNFKLAILYEEEAMDRFQVTDPATAGDKSEFAKRLQAFKAGKTYLQVKPPATQPG